jgi:Protein of unknown function (DUF3303)
MARMLFMVIEHFRNGDPRPVRERFLSEGRLLPVGVVYHASWLDPSKACCYQVMEARDAKAIKVWTDRWSDLVEFEVIPVVTSQEFWATFPDEGASSSPGGDAS